MIALNANPWTAENWNVTNQGQFVKRFGLAVATRRAKEAGSSIGALRPSPMFLQNNKIYILQGRRGPPGKDAPTAVHEFAGFYGAGPFNNAQYFTLAAVPTPTKFPTSLSPDESRALCSIAPTGNTEFYLTNNLPDFLGSGGSVICTVSFAAGQTTGTFAYGSPITLPIDTPLYVVCAAVADPTITGVEITFCGDPA